MNKLKDREERKKYYLRLKPKYNYLKRNTRFNYLNLEAGTGEVFISDTAGRYNSDGVKLDYITAFTEEEINELSKRYNTYIFERVEVEDD